MTLKRLYEESWEHKCDRLGNGIEIGSRRAVALDLLGGGGSLLDVGCGNGELLNAARGRYNEIRGVEISELAAAEAGKLRVDVTMCDLNEQMLPFPAESFDTVASLDVLEHVIDPERFASELGRVLKPGGRMIISTPNIRYVKRVAHLVLRGRFPHTSGDPIGFDGGHLHYFTHRDVVELFDRCARCQHDTTVAVIPSQRLRFLRPFSRLRVVYEWLAPGMVVMGHKSAAL